MLTNAVHLEKLESLVSQLSAGAGVAHELAHQVNRIHRRPLPIGGPCLIGRLLLKRGLVHKHFLEKRSHVLSQILCGEENHETEIKGIALASGSEANGMFNGHRAICVA